MPARFKLKRAPGHVAAAVVPKSSGLRTANHRLPDAVTAPVAGAEGPRTRVDPGQAAPAAPGAMDFGTPQASAQSQKPNVESAVIDAAAEVVLPILEAVRVRARETG